MRNGVIRVTFWWILVLSTLANLLWAWTSLPHGPDTWFLFVAAVALFPIPLLLVLRWNLIGVVWGSFCVFGSCMVLRKVGEGVDPTFHGDGALVYTEKTVVLWIAGVTLCLLIYGMKRLTIRLLHWNKQRERDTHVMDKSD
jgi:hypothetical protein